MLFGRELNGRWILMDDKGHKIPIVIYDASVNDMIEEYYSIFKDRIFNNIVDIKATMIIGIMDK